MNEKMKNKYVLGLVAFGIIALLGISMVAANGFAWSQEDKEVMQANREAVQTAVENNDYAAWESLMQERVQKMQDNINEGTFEAMKTRHAQMSEFRAAMQEAMGDKEAMQAVREQYDFSGQMGRGIGNHGMGMKGNCPMAE